MGTFFNVLSEQNITEHFFGVERSVLSEHLNPVFPRTLKLSTRKWTLDSCEIVDMKHWSF